MPCAVSEFSCAYDYLYDMAIMHNSLYLLQNHVDKLVYLDEGISIGRHTSSACCVYHIYAFW